MATGAQVDVWVAQLDLPVTVLSRLAGALSAEERIRADRFHFERDSRRFMAARALLRGVLGGYLDRDPGAIEFEYGPYGKPALSAGTNSVPLYFNVSHSESTALYAVSRFHDVGVDVERIRADFPVDEVAARFCCAAEVQSLRDLPPLLCRQRFYAFWTRKEAYSKARARGLSLDPARIDVSTQGDFTQENSTQGNPSATGEAASAAFHVRLDGGVDPELSLYDLWVADGFAAALAVVGGVARIDVRPLMLP
jgi:4'-phosphopantetheinyl transferase